MTKTRNSGIHPFGAKCLSPSFPIQFLRPYLLSSLLPPFQQSHCGARTLVPQSALAGDFFTLRGNNSAPPGV